jgi:hypothetical protein
MLGATGTIQALIREPGMRVARSYPRMVSSQGNGKKHSVHEHESSLAVASVREHKDSLSKLSIELTEARVLESPSEPLRAPPIREHINGEAA